MAIIMGRDGYDITARPSMGRDGYDITRTATPNTSFGEMVVSGRDGYDITAPAVPAATMGRDGYDITRTVAFPGSNAI